MPDFCMGGFWMPDYFAWVDFKSLIYFAVYLDTLAGKAKIAK